MAHGHQWLYCSSLIGCLLGLLSAMAQPAGSAQLPPNRAESRISALMAAGPGYGELVAAADLCAEAPVLKNGEWRSATLRARRAALLSPALRQSLRLIESGLRKPMLLPPGGLALQESEREQLRLLPRLCGLRMAVQLAGGDAAGALESLEQGLRLVDAIQVGGISSSLPVLDEGSSLLSILPPLMVTLPARECEQMAAAMALRIAGPTPQESVIEVQRRQDQAALREAGLDAPELKTALAALDLRYRRLYEQIRLPAWQRTSPRPGDAAARREATGDPALAALVEAHETWKARILLLELMARVERFRWEHRRLPANLAELGEPGKRPDPFSGQPFLYRRTGTSRYEVTSVGPPPPAGRPRKEISLRPDETEA